MLISPRINLRSMEKVIPILKEVKRIELPWEMVKMDVQCMS